MAEFYGGKDKHTPPLLPGPGTPRKFPEKPVRLGQEKKKVAVGRVFLVDRAFFTLGAGTQAGQHYRKAVSHSIWLWLGVHGGWRD